MGWNRTEILLYCGVGSIVTFDRWRILEVDNGTFSSVGGSMLANEVSSESESECRRRLMMDVGVKLGKKCVLFESGKSEVGMPSKVDACLSTQLEVVSKVFSKILC